MSVYGYVYLLAMCVCRFGLPVSGVVAVSTAMSDGMKSCGQGENVLGLNGILTLCLKVVPCLLVVRVAIINGGNCFYSSEWHDITGLAKLVR